MNCKQGDLAIIVTSYSGNEGMIVRCVRYLGPITYQYPNGSLESHDSWEVDHALKTTRGTYSNHVIDAYMRPLRGDLLNDETTHSKELESV